MDIARQDGELMLVFPNAGLEKEYLEYLAEWQMTDEAELPWSLELDPSDFRRLIQRLEGFRKGRGLPPGFVPYTCLWLVHGSGRLLGFIEIRHALTEDLAWRGGHIGYGIRPGERRKGYGRRMLALALPYCRELGLTSVMISCARANTASARIIRHNGGILDSEDTDFTGEAFQRYWIHLK